MSRRLSLALGNPITGVSDGQKAPPQVASQEPSLHHLKQVTYKVPMRADGEKTI